MTIDASVILAWLFDEGGRTAALDPLVRGSPIVVPSVWRLEIAHVLMKRVRGKILTEADALSMADIVGTLSVEVADTLSSTSTRAIIDFAARDQLSSYDAAYLHTAMSRSVPLATFDNNLITAAKRLGVTLQPV